MNPVKHTREIGTLKTFYVQKYNDEGELLDRFEKYSMHDQNEFSSFLKRVEGKGLESICASDEVPNVITSLRDINTENYYRISASHLTVIRKGITWSQIEDQAIEMETLLAVEKALRENIRTPSLKIFNKRILFDSKKNPIFEVDGIIICDDTALLIESKHNMLKKHIESLTERLGEFPEKLKIATESDPEFLKLLEKSYVGVVCGTKFPEELRDLSKIRGFIVVFPGGNRYKVEIPEELSKYWQL